MTYSLFLDDLRDPLAPPPFGEWVVVRSSYRALVVLDDLGCPGRMSLDHDLGGDDTAMAYVRGLIERHLDGDVDLAGLADVVVHSANPVGARNIIGLWDGFAESQGIGTRGRWEPRYTTEEGACPPTSST